MNKLIGVALIVALGGCSNMSPAGNAVLGAAVGVAVVEHANQRQPVYVQHNPIYIPPPPRARHCVEIPMRDYYGRIVGFRTNCY